MKTTVTAFVAAALCAFVLPATTQAADTTAVTPPAAVVNPNVSSVANILANGVDEQMVVLEGSIIEDLGDERYTFADPTGTVRVEIDSDDYPLKPVDRTTKLYISGRVDKDSPAKGVEIDVDTVKVLD